MAVPMVTKANNASTSQSRFESPPIVSPHTSVNRRLLSTVPQLAQPEKRRERQRH